MCQGSSHFSNISQKISFCPNHSPVVKGLSHLTIEPISSMNNENNLHLVRTYCLGLTPLEIS